MFLPKNISIDGILQILQYKQIATNLDVGITCNKRNDNYTCDHYILHIVLIMTQNNNASLANNVTGFQIISTIRSDFLVV